MGVPPAGPPPDLLARSVDLVGELVGVLPRLVERGLGQVEFIEALVRRLRCASSRPTVPNGDSDETARLATVTDISSRPVGSPATASGSDRSEGGDQAATGATAGARGPARAAKATKAGAAAKVPRPAKAAKAGAAAKVPRAAKAAKAGAAAKVPRAIRATPATKADTSSEAATDSAGPGLAIPAYDDLAASQVIPLLDGLTPAEVEAIRLHETTGRGRRTILARIGQIQEK